MQLPDSANLSGFDDLQDCSSTTQVLHELFDHTAFKTRLPFGLPSVNKVLNLSKFDETFAAQYLLMATYFAVSKAVMIGLAAKYRSGFAAEHVVRTIQSVSKMMEHCETYPARVIEMLASRGIRNSAGIAVLTQD
jgi:hypothetical protein